MWDRFSIEDSKSKLVNDLLAKHYSITIQEPRIVEAGDVKEFKLTDPKSFLKPVKKKLDLNRMVDEVNSHTISKYAVVKNIPKSSRFDGPLCKIHSLPLDGRGKCLQKGCKYA